MLLSLRKLIFNNIATFVTEQTVDFSQYDGEILQINGINNDTGGGSGAAKSSIFHANDYLLGVNEIPATALQSRLVKAGMYVEGHFDVGGKILVLRRSKKDGLTLKYGDETVSGNVKLAEERLWEIIGIPKNLFKKMIHKPQKEMGFFLKFTAKQSYEFLMTSLGLEDTGKQTAKIDEDIKSIINRITQLGHAIDAFESSIEEIEELKEFEKEPVCTVTEVELQCAEGKVQNFNDIIKKIETERDKVISEIVKNAPIKPIIEKQENYELEDFKLQLVGEEKLNEQLIFEHLKSTTNINEARDKVNSELAKIPFHQENIQRKADEMKQLIEKKKHLEDEKCPTCMQKWSDSAQEIETINIRLNTNKEQILEHKIIVDSEGPLREKITKIDDILGKMQEEHKAKLAEKNTIISRIKEKIIKIQASFDGEASKVENEYLKNLNQHNIKVSEGKESYNQLIKDNETQKSVAQMSLNGLRQSFENYSHNIEMYNLKMVKYCDTLTEKKNNLKDAKNQRDVKAKELAIAEETKRLIKTYTLQIFQDTLDYIGNYATQILADIPNMQNATIYFEGCKENKTGSIRDEVNAIINMSGYDNINIKTLSGGERTVIDLAVDLAVIDMIESKAGKGADFFILDEPFTGLEDINITQCLEILKQVDTNKKIIIVDHNPIAKEMITGSIIVEKTDGQSVVL